MTDNEIIHILKNHIEAEDCVSCESFGKCDEFLITEKVLDLINRQQAEIERLKGYPYATQVEVSKKLESQIKSEAIKEFANKFEFEIVNKPSEFKAVQATVDFLSGIAHRQHEILGILKEMVGGKECEKAKNPME